MAGKARQGRLGFVQQRLLTIINWDLPHQPSSFQVAGRDLLPEPRLPALAEEQPVATGVSAWHMASRNLFMPTADTIPQCQRLRLTSQHQSEVRSQSCPRPRSFGSWGQPHVPELHVIGGQASGAATTRRHAEQGARTGSSRRLAETPASMKWTVPQLPPTRLRQVSRLARSQLLPDRGVARQRTGPNTLSPCPGGPTCLRE